MFIFSRLFSKNIDNVAPESPKVAPESPPKGGLFSAEGKVKPDKPEEVLIRAFSACFQRDAIFAYPRKSPVHGQTDVAATDSSDTGVIETKTQQSLLGNHQQMAWFAQSSFIGHQANALLAQHWLIEKACSQPALDATRNGYEITLNDGESAPEDVEKLRSASQRLKVAESLVEFVTKMRVFGVRIAMCDFGLDASELEAPFNVDGVKAGSYRGLKQFDPYWITPELTQESINPLALDFYEPTYWRVGQMRIHKSHLVIARYGHLPDILKPTYFYGGISIPQLIKDRVYAAEQTINEVPKLAMTKRLNVLKCDVDTALLNRERLTERLELFQQLRDNHGIKLIGTDEEIQQIDTSLGELDEVVMTMYQVVAAASKVPATKLLGTSPKGFNATGEYDERSYHEELRSIQESVLTPLLNRHFEVLCRSERIDVDVKIEWKPCDTPSAQDLANLLKNRADMDAAYVNIGAISPEHPPAGVPDRAAATHDGREPAFSRR